MTIGFSNLNRFVITLTSTNNFITMDFDYHNKKLRKSMTKMSSLQVKFLNPIRMCDQNNK